MIKAQEPVLLRVFMRVRSSFETQVLVAFLTAVLVVAVLAAATWKVSRDAVEGALQMSRTHDMLNNLVADGDIPPHVDRVLAKPPRLREVRAALARLCPAGFSERAA